METQFMTLIILLILVLLWALMEIRQTNIIIEDMEKQTEITKKIIEQMEKKEEK